MRAAPFFPWYDSSWHSAHAKARAWLQEKQPGKLIEFDSMLQPLRTSEDFKTIQLSSLLGGAELGQLRNLVAQLNAKDLDEREEEYFGRKLFRNHPPFLELQKKFLPIVQDLVKEELEVSYNFLSLYGPDGVCPIHLDAPEAKWTLDICVDIDGEWPLNVGPVEPWPTDFTAFAGDWENKLLQNRSFQAFNMKPGDALLFSGSSQWHYRRPFGLQNAQCQLLFFHYLPRGMGVYRYPKAWEMQLNVPGLQCEAERRWL